MNGDDQAPPVATALPLVCIGASAGGLEPLSRLLRSLGDGCGFAYVVIQHLDPEHPSQLVHLLSQATPMTVVEAVEGVVPAAGHVYVIPPNQGLRIRDGALRLKARGDRSARHLPIDAFLRSLAAERGSRAIAVILSGGGEDGALGVAEIQAAGGITFAQDDSASIREMPHSAIATGDVDFVLAPEAISAELARIARHSYLLDWPQPDAAAGTQPAPAPSTADAEQMQRILGIVGERSGVDFSTYRMTMIERRIRRRMALRDRIDVSAYASEVEGNPEESQRLADDLHIGVTAFFRDADVFSVLRTKVLADLVARKAGKEPIRIWVAGCSTGEEAYSLAIEILDLCGELGHHPFIQIFATDISDAAITRARSGIYPRGIIADVSPERLQRYFAPAHGGFRIDKSVRDLCVFARHNLNADTPFSRLDVVSCRNVLIYFGAAMQERAIATFHHALSANGTLLLGSSESVGNSRLFKPVDAKCHIFSKLANTHATAPMNRASGAPAQAATIAPYIARESPAVRTVGAVSAELRKEADRIVLERFGPAGVLVDGALGILQFRGEIAPYLAPAQGKASLDLLKVVHPSLVHSLETAIAKAREQGGGVRTQTVWFPSHGVTTDVGIEVVPVVLPADAGECYLVLLEDSTSARVMPRPPAPVPMEEQATETQELPWIRQQLAATKQYLASVIEQHAIASERMQGAGDDLQSANEELRVTNEEIQSAKEEQESANEELATLLEELRRRNHELNELNDDLANLLERITIPVIILGEDLRIRRLTASARTMIAAGTDVGRPVADLRNSFQGLDLEAAARAVVQSGTSHEAEARDQSGAWCMVRVHPYGVQVGADRHTHGAVITVQDIDRLKRSEITLNEAAGFTRAIVETIPAPMVVLDANLRVTMANRAFCDTFRVSREETVDRPFGDLCDGEWRIPELLDSLRGVIEQRIPIDGFEVGRTFPATGYRMLTLTARRLDQDHDGRPMAILSMTDLTEHLRLEVESRRFKFISERSSDCHLLVDQAGRYAYANRSACELMGCSYEGLTRMSSDDVATQWTLDALTTVRRQAQSAPVPLFEAICVTGDGRQVPTEGSATALVLGDSHYVLLSIRDVSARKRTEANLVATAEELRRSNAELDRFASVASHDLQEPLRMISGYLDLALRSHSSLLDDKTKEYLGVALNGAKRMSTMIRSVLEYARFECSDVREAVDTKTALANAVENLKQLTAETGAQIAHGTLPVVQAAPNQLELVFQNLIGNAIKYRSPERPPRIAVAADESPQCWTFSVTDNGIGISAPDTERVFDLFQRLDPQATEGTGIGLATTKKIIGHHGGRIWLRSTVGEGTVFFFTVPKSNDASSEPFC